MARRRVGVAACVLAGVAASVLATETRAEWHVWTVKPTVRALRDAPAGEGTAMRLAAARNEWESFQVLMRADAPVKAVRVEAGDLLGPGARSCGHPTPASFASTRWN